jgi:hypothetical protein
MTAERRPADCRSQDGNAGRRLDAACTVTVAGAMLAGMVTVTD